MSNVCCNSTQKQEFLSLNRFAKKPNLVRGKGRSLVSRLRGLFVSDSEGGALVEMAVTLPIAMAVMTGIFSFSIVLYQKLQLCEAVSNAGHLLATDRGDTDPCGSATAAIYAAAPGLTQSKLTLAYTLNGTNYGSGVTTCPGPSGATNANMVANGTAEVQASYTCVLGVYGTNYTSCSVATQITENVQ
jgi:Flp pilus assembly protein TadG